VIGAVEPTTTEGAAGGADGSHHLILVCDVLGTVTSTAIQADAMGAPLPLASTVAIVPVTGELEGSVSHDGVGGRYWSCNTVPAVC
jgi:hypothetical protein